MNFRAIVRHIDDTKAKYDVTDVQSINHAFDAIKSEDPNCRVALLLVQGGKKE